MNPVLAINLLSPNFGLFFWMSVTFGLLLFVLKKLAWVPITTALRDRETRAIQMSKDELQQLIIKIVKDDDVLKAFKDYQMLLDSLDKVQS